MSRPQGSVRGERVATPRSAGRRATRRQRTRDAYDGELHFTETLDAATWGTELAVDAGRGHIYLAEPTGPSVAEMRAGLAAAMEAGEAEIID